MRREGVTSPTCHNVRLWPPFVNIWVELNGYAAGEFSSVIMFIPIVMYMFS